MPAMLAWPRSIAPERRSCMRQRKRRPMAAFSINILTDYFIR